MKEPMLIIIISSAHFSIDKSDHHDHIPPLRSETIYSDQKLSRKILIQRYVLESFYSMNDFETSLFVRGHIL